VIVHVQKHSTVYGLPCTKEKWRGCSSNAYIWLRFREIEGKCSLYKDEAQNVRISLAVDGFNPFGDLKSIYSMWPIFVIKNNLPP